MNESYDYIIVGAGSPGCVMGDRLCQPSIFVLLIESWSGAHQPLISRMPRGIEASLLMPGNPHVLGIIRRPGERHGHGSCGSTGKAIAAPFR